MNTIIWLVFLYILARIFFRLLGRTGSRGGFDGPLGGPLPGMGRPIPTNEEKPKLNIPEYLTRRNEERSGELIKAKDMEEETAEVYYKPDALAGETAEPCLKKQRSGTYSGPLKGDKLRVAGGPGDKNVSPARMRRKQSNPEDIFSDMLCPAQVAKGMAWSMILGSRGGLRPKR